MKLRRWLLVLLLTLLCLPSVVPAAKAQSPDIQILLDGQRLYSDVPPYILSKVNVTMVPTRVISEGLGASIAWNQSTKTAVISQQNISISLKSGSPTAIVNGVPEALSASVQIQNGRVMVPLRFISEKLGLTVKWNQQQKIIDMTSGWIIPEEPGIPPVVPQPVEKELRGAWVSSIYNLDWPATKTTAAQQQQDFIQMLDKLQAAGFNAVFVQLRPAGDALYSSALVPWSKALTGTQGKDPGYDPAAFMIQETQKRGMEFHAWFNPFRAHTELSTSGLAANHIAVAHPDWILKVNSQLMIDPGNPAARQHIIDTIIEVVDGYDVDGIHLDDYFYPSNTSIPDSSSYALYNTGSYRTVADWRRGNVNTFIEELGESIKRVKPQVYYGVSPFGVWRNDTADRTGSPTKAGVTAYDSMYADTRTWIQNGWIDYIAPQIYWSMNYTAADYDKLVDWWVKEVSGTGVDLLIGHAAYKVGDPAQDKNWQTATEIINQLRYNDKYKDIQGSLFFRAKHLLGNPLGLLDQLKLYYQS
ncbi:family 10 glycosylhydrolase [Paenibacillus sp. F411]|uniref:family 10 glycosylhydrolase n=1 Tax=Paenibacillus sp. F411 TaxID=2820239 RepID=UPI001AAFA77F|nr:family 10 glycosylhydrolase [Paenibacillus sp. F411]MBO2945135.1 family 10 glycosylhydrolase [Paenibacillus sp. F411]